MSLGELQLLQPEAGYRPGARSHTEKWIVVKLVHGGFIGSVIGQIGTLDSYGWMDSFREYQVQGKYSIVNNNMTPESSRDYTIGDNSHHSYKIWRYNMVKSKLYFCTIANVGGGGLKFGETKPEIKDDMVLNGVGLTKKGFVPLRGNAIDSDGRVLTKSWIKPFEERPIFWNSI